MCLRGTKTFFISAKRFRQTGEREREWDSERDGRGKKKERKRYIDREKVRKWDRDM